MSNEAASTGDSPDEFVPIDKETLDRLLNEVLVRTVDDCTRLVSAERLTGGASQETYRITVETADGSERSLAMRRAPGGVGNVHHQTTAPGLATEALLMQVAGDHGVPEPTIFHVLEPDDGLGEGFIMSWLEGEALGARIVRSPELDDIRPHLARECGEILARIHGIDVEATGLAERMSAVGNEEFVRLMWERYQEYETPEPMIDYTARWLLDNLPTEVAPALVHNDFRNGNIMFSPDGVVAVLDWEVAHIGDPMRDLGWICTNSWRFGRRDLPVGGFGSYEDLFAGYESVAGAPVDRDAVKFWEVFGSFWWAVGCKSMAEHYRNGPDKTVERPGIARRSSECQVDCVNLIIPGPVDLVEPEPFDAGPTASDMPRMDELISSVRDFLHGDVMGETTGRVNFLSRVAGNSLDIVLRELTLAPELRRRRRTQLSAIVGETTDTDETGLDELTWRLVHQLRDGSMELDRPGLVEHLRESVVNQVAIDQPKYSGFRHAAGR